MLRPAVPDGTAPVAERNVNSARGDQQLRDGRRSGAGAVEDNAHFRQLFPHQLQRVCQPRKGDDGCPVLVVMEDGDIAAFLEPPLDFKAARCGNVFEVDAAEGF